MFDWIEAYHFDGARARARAKLSDRDPLFADHFPGYPVVPGSVLIELGAQVAGPLAEAHSGDGQFAFLAMVRSAKFHAPVMLPCTLAIDASIRRAEAGSTVCAVKVGEAASMELVMVVRRLPADPEAIRARRERLDRWQAAWT